VAAVVVRWKIFSSHRREWCVVCLLFLDSYEERKERVRWLRWYLGNVSHAWPKFIWRGTPDWWVEKIFHSIGGETSGFTTAATAKAMNALSGKGLACGGHPPQETAVITAPPQNRSCEYSIRCLSIIYRNDNVRFMLTQVPPFTSDLLEEMQIMADQQQATGAIFQGIL
jgi:hypothetical protein